MLKDYPILQDPALFIIGSINTPTTFPWIKYTEWAHKYGDVMYLRILGQDTIFVNSVAVATELFEKRSKVYSDRPHLPMIDLRLFHQAFRPQASFTYRPTQLNAVHAYLRQILNSPNNIGSLNRNLAASIIMKTVYGYDIKPQNDRYIHIAEETVSSLSNAVLPGAALLNAIPILRYIPEWFPGADFQRIIKECKQSTEEMQNAPLKFVKENMEAGTGLSCVASKLLKRNFDGSQKQEEANKAQPPLLTLQERIPQFHQFHRHFLPWFSILKL